MNVRMTAELDESLAWMIETIGEFEERLAKYFHDKDFGDEVANIFIVVILVAERFKDMHPVRPLKYQKRLKVSFANVVLENVVEYDVEAPFDLFSRLKRKQARQSLAELLVDSVDVMESNIKKFPSFRVPEFKQALQQCLLGGSDRAIRPAIGDR